MRVLLVHTDIQGGGVEKVLVTLATHLPVEAKAIAYYPANHPEPPEDFKHYLSQKGVQLFRAPVPLLSIRYLFWLRSLIKNWSPHIVHFHGTLPGVIGGMLRRFVPTPPVFLYTQHPRHSHDAPWLRLLGGRTFFRFLDHIICVSNAVHDDLLSIAGQALSKKVSVIYNGIDLQPFSSPSSPAERARLRRSIGLAPGDVVIGSVGLLWPPKGYPDLLQAFKTLSQRLDTPLKLVLVGDGPQRPELEELSQTLGIHRNVLFLGWRPDVPSLLQTFDIYVQPSHTEGLPMALLEASASALPIVATAVGGVPELLSDGYNALLVQPGDTTAMAKALECLITNPQLAKSLAHAARHRVIEDFSAQAMANAHLSLYERLLREAGSEK